MERRDAKLLFIWSQAVVIDELKNRKRAVGLMFFDFVEALARLAEFISPPSMEEMLAAKVAAAAKAAEGSGGEASAGTLERAKNSATARDASTPPERVRGNAAGKEAGTPPPHPLVEHLKATKGGRRLRRGVREDGERDHLPNHLLCIHFPYHLPTILPGVPHRS